ncbi:MAG: hypothetical protein Q8877_03640, partial [Sweet potato little leaf phytoplasma]|nr:hypothetical protein [Sweet potato little leaf phytoplasma]
IDAQRFFKDTSQMPLFSQLIGMSNEKEQLQDYLNYLKNTNHLYAVKYQGSIPKFFLKNRISK